MKGAVIKLKKKNSVFLQSYQLLRIPKSFVNIFSGIFQMEGGGFCCCFTKVRVLRCRKSRLFSEEQQPLPQPFALAEILKQPLRGKQRQKSYRLVDLIERQVLSLSFLGNTGRGVWSTDKSQHIPHVPPWESDPSRVTQTPAPSLKIFLLGKPKQTAWKTGFLFGGCGGEGWHHLYIPNRLWIWFYWLVKRII